MTNNSKNNKNSNIKSKIVSEDRNIELSYSNSSFLNVLLLERPFLTLITLLILISTFVFYDFLSFEYVYLFKDIGSDTLNGLYPPMLNTARYIKENGIPSWSFNYGMGQNIFPFFLRDPFDLFLYQLDVKNISYALAYKEVVKIILTGVIFYFYLKRLNFYPLTNIIGSLLFSFSGFMIVGSGWYMFSFEVLNFALLLLAFENIFQNRNWYLFPIAIALIVISMPFNLYVYGLFLLIYSIIRFLESEKSFSFKKLSFLLLKLLFFGLLGIAISSIFLVENVVQLLESPRGSGGSSYFETLSKNPIFETGNLLQNVTTIFRFFSSDLLGTGSDFKGAYNYLEAPLLYCGLITSLLIPQLFFLVERRKKIIFGALLLIVILPLLFPYFRQAFWLFSGDYYRAYSFFVAFVFIYLSVQTLNQLFSGKKLNIKVLIISVVLLLITLSYNYLGEKSEEVINMNLLNLIRIFLVLYVVLILLINSFSTNLVLQSLFVSFICFELAYFSSFAVKEREKVSVAELNEKTGYNDNSVEALKFIKKRDSSFFRIDKNYFSSPAIHYSLNDGLAQNYYGTSAYHSFNQNNYVNFFTTLGLIDPNNESDTRWVRGVPDKPLYEIICNVKYFLTKNELNPLQRLMFDSIAKFGDVLVLQHNYALPLGFTYDQYISSDDFKKCNLEQKNITLLNNFIPNENLEKSLLNFKKYDLRDTIPGSKFNFDSLANLISQLKEDTLQIKSFKPTQIKGSIQIDRAKMLFFAIPFDLNWQAFVNNKKVELNLLNGGMMGIVLDAGKHEITLKYVHRYFNFTLWISIGSITLFLILVVFFKTNNAKNRRKN